MASRFTDVDDYISSFPPGVAEVLTEIRRRIHLVVPEGVEVIRYDMPTVQLDGSSLVHFAGWKAHVSLYPTPAGDEALLADLAPYDSGKGTCKFSLTAPIPYDLVERLVRSLLEQRLA